MNEFYPALLLTLLAGLSTGIGSAMALVVKHTNIRFLTLALGFSAGIMLYVSFVELLPQSEAALLAGMPAQSAAWISTLAFLEEYSLYGLLTSWYPMLKIRMKCRLSDEWKIRFPTACA